VAAIPFAVSYVLLWNVPDIGEQPSCFSLLASLAAICVRTLTGQTKPPRCSTTRSSFCCTSRSFR
jgi:hypothetical protein